MAIIAKYNKDQETLGAEIRSLTRMANDFGHKVNQRLKKAIMLDQIEQWDDPVNVPLLNTRLDTLTANSDKTENDLVTIAAICAILTNFVEEEEVQL